MDPGSIMFNSGQFASELGGSVSGDGDGLSGTFRRTIVTCPFLGP